MFRKFLLIIVTVNCFVLCLVGCSDRSELLSIPVDLQPTAIYLHENISPIPDYIVSIYPYRGVVNTSQTDICMTIDVGILLGNEEINWLEANITIDVTIDGTSIRHEYGQSIYTSQLTFCGQSFIDLGIHLVSVDIHANPRNNSGEMIVNYTWAFLNE